MHSMVLLAATFLASIRGWLALHGCELATAIDTCIACQWSQDLPRHHRGKPNLNRPADRCSSRGTVFRAYRMHGRSVRCIFCCSCLSAGCLFMEAETLCILWQIAATKEVQLFRGVRMSIG